MNSVSIRKPILVLGIGNILLGDEGIGIHVIQKLQENSLSDKVELLDGGTCGANFMDVLADRQKVVVIDAVHANHKPATVLRFNADDLEKPNCESLSLHDVGLGETLMMTKQLGCAPKDVVVIGIVPKNIQAGLTLSPEIATLIPKIIELVLEEITEYSLD